MRYPRVPYATRPPRAPPCTGGGNGGRGAAARAPAFPPPAPLAPHVRARDVRTPGRRRARPPPPLRARNRGPWASGPATAALMVRPPRPRAHWPSRPRRADLFSLIGPVIRGSASRAGRVRASILVGGDPSRIPPAAAGRCGRTAHGENGWAAVPDALCIEYPSARPRHQITWDDDPPIPIFSVDSPVWGCLVAHGAERRRSRRLWQSAWQSRGSPGGRCTRVGGAHSQAHANAALVAPTTTA